VGFFSFTQRAAKWFCQCRAGGRAAGMRLPPRASSSGLRKRDFVRRGRVSHAPRCASPHGGRVAAVKPAPGLAAPAFSPLPDGAGLGSRSSPGSCPPATAPSTCPCLPGGRAAARTVLLLLLLFLLLCPKVGLRGAAAA